MKKGTLIVSVLTLALLQACGGDGSDNSNVTPAPSGSGGGGDGGGSVTPPGGTGGGDGGNVTPPGGSGGDDSGSGGTTPPPATGNDQGSVSAPFVATSPSRYMLDYQNGWSNGVLVGTEQATSGAIVGLTRSSDAVSLSGSSATKDIAGDASYALGRWVTGTVTTASGADQLTGTDDRSYHYAAYNILASFPATGSYACTLQSATTPTRVSGSGAMTGVVDGAINLSFDATGANLSGAMTVTVGAETVTAGVPTSIGSPTSLAATGQFYANNTGTGVQVADAGNGNYALMVAYAAKLANTSLYHGIARLSCAAN